MRITLINRFYAPDQSATAQLLTDLAEHLASSGHQVQVITSRLDYARGMTDWPPLETRNGVQVRRVKTTGFGRHSLRLRVFDYLSFYLSAFIAVLWHVRRGELVVVKTDPPLLAVALAPAIALKRAGLVNWLQDLYPEVAERLDVRLPASVFGALRSLRNRTLRAARLNGVLGERMRDEISAHSEHICVLPNWAIHPTEQAPATPNPLRLSLGFDEQFVVGYSGNLGRAHDFSVILAAARALQHDAQIQFLIIGGGAGKLELQAAAAAERLPNLHFLPYQALERLNESLGAIDLHLISLNPAMEGLIVPSKLYGILAAGRATLFLGDPAGDIARTLAAHSAGLSTASGAIDGLLLELKQDRARLHAFGLRAREAHLAVFARERALENWTRALLAC